MSSLTEAQVLSVMAYADGEVDGALRDQVRELLAGSAEARELAASLSALGDGVRAAASTPAKIDMVASVMAAVAPNDLDRARLRRQSRARSAVVLGTLAAIAAGVWLYVHPASEPSNTAFGELAAPSTHERDVPAPAVTVASLDLAPVQIDAVDTPSPVSLFYVPQGPDNASAPDSVVVWINELVPEAKQ